MQGANLALSSAKKSNKQGAAAATPHPRAGARAAVGGKDQSLVLFHGLGKVLYAKRASAAGLPEPCPLPAALERHRRFPLLADPEQVLENTPIRCVFYPAVCQPVFSYVGLDNVLEPGPEKNINSCKKILKSLFIVVVCNQTHLQYGGYR